MAAGRHEEDMEVDDVSSTVPGSLYRWIDYALTDPKVFDSQFVYEDNGYKHQWKITEVQYQLIRHFCSQERVKLSYRSTYLCRNPYVIEHIAIAGGLSEDIKCIVKDIETKLFQVCYVEMNQAVTDELEYSYLERFNTTDCFVCIPKHVPKKKICIFGSSIKHLYNAFEALCTEFEKRKGGSSGTNFNFTRNSAMLNKASFDESSYLGTTLSSSTLSNSTDYQENKGVMIGFIKLLVYRGSILDANVKAIVNAANKSLTFDAGVSRVIHQAAGYQYEKECKNLLKRESPYLQTSKCYPSDPGRLKYKFEWILHAVGPHWNDYETKECIYSLALTVTNMLMLADSLYIPAVAMPAISSGKSLVPIELCALAYIIGIQQFGEGKTLQEVHFVDTDIAVVNEMKAACSKYKKNPKSITLEAMKSLYPKHFGIRDEDPGNRISTSNGNAQVAIAQPASSNVQPLQFLEGSILVKVYQGSILKVKADAIVNAANEGLLHGAGVALAIRDAAGDEFDDECQRVLRYMKSSLKTTQVVATSSGNLKKQFKYILNAVGPRWDQYQEKTQCLFDLHDTIVNILNEAEKLQIGSLVMPAISCGIFAVPLKLCAEMYLRGIISFSRHTALYLKEIHIVDIDVSVLREMTDAYHNYKKKPDSISISGAKTRHPDLMITLTPSSRKDIENKKGVSASHADTAQQINNVKTPTSSESRSYEHSRTERLSQSKGGCLFKMKDEKFGQQTAKVFTFKDKMVVKIYTGSIVRFQGDALICSNDDGMSGIGPLAKAVAAGGGSKYNESYSKMKKKSQYGLYKWKLGDVETCSGGDLNVRFVVHAVIQSMFRTDQESLKSYKTTLMKIFYTINSYNNSTKFAMPLIGAGIWSICYI